MMTLRIEEADSTNSWVKEHESGLQPTFLLFADRQTAGRGQRGNSWESEPYMNLTASICLRPEGILPSEQFLISEAVSMAVVDLLAELGVETKVKWPNDIYAGDMKICGILIEHSIMPDRILRTIAGVGVNVNQTRFVSDAPNPVSVKQLTGESHEVSTVARRLAELVEMRMAGMYADKRGTHEEYMSRLWRADGTFHPFLDCRTNEKISARIADVAPDGMLTLETDGGESRRYAFKEVSFML